MAKEKPKKLLFEKINTENLGAVYTRSYFCEQFFKQPFPRKNLLRGDLAYKSPVHRLVVDEVEKVHHLVARVVDDAQSVARKVVGEETS